MHLPAHTEMVIISCLYLCKEDTIPAEDGHKTKDRAGPAKKGM